LLAFKAYFLTAGFAVVGAAAVAAGAVPETVISGFSLASVLSPNPGTLFKSSTVLKLPFFLRYSIIASALDGPYCSKGMQCKAKT
jgi:hypothetical protein